MSDRGVASGRGEDLSVANRQNGSGKGVTASFPILTRTDFSKSTFLIEIEHPVMAKAAKPGQFVIVMLHELGERIPLTIADFDREEGTITLVVQAVGKSTRRCSCSADPVVRSTPCSALLVFPVTFHRKPKRSFVWRRARYRAYLPAGTGLQGSWRPCDRGSGLPLQQPNVLGREISRHL